MSTCGKCGVEMKVSAKFCKSCGNDLSKSGASFSEKKGRIMRQEKSWMKPAAIAALVIVIAAGAWMFKESRANSSGKPMFAPHRDASLTAAKAAAVTAEDGKVRIPLKSVEDGNAHFYSYQTSGRTVTFFVMKAADGSIKTAFDACISCNHAKLGYRQEGGLVVCNNCGLAFKPGDIGNITGGCSPIPVQKAADGQMLVIKTADLDTGAQYF